MMVYYAIKDVIDHWDVIGMFPYIPNDEYKEYIDRMYDYISKQEKLIMPTEVQGKLVEVFDFCKGFHSPTPNDPATIEKYGQLLVDQINMGYSEIDKNFGKNGLLSKGVYFYSTKVVCDILDYCKKRGASVVQIQAFQLIDENLLPMNRFCWNVYSEVTKKKFWLAYQSSTEKYKLNIVYRVGILSEENKKLLEVTKPQNKSIWSIFLPWREG